MKKCMKCGGAMNKMAKGGASKSCPPGQHMVNGICTPKPLSSTGSRIGVGTVVAGAAGMIGKAIKDRRDRKKEEMKTTGAKAAKSLKKADSGMIVKPKVSKPTKVSTAVPRKYATGGATGIVGMPQYGNNPRTYSGAMLQKGGAFAPNRAVQSSCKNGMVRDASGRCVMERKMAKGGAAKYQDGGKVANVRVASSTDPYPTEQRRLEAAKARVKKTYDQKMKAAAAKLAAEKNAQNKSSYKQATKRYQKGGFPDLTGDGKVTKADVLKGRGVIKKKGGEAGGDKKWIQKAINPAHKGYCTPMTKPTCTPKRKALAKTLKKMAKNR